MEKKRIELVLNVTNGCNLDCHYCYYANEMKARPANMDLETLEKIFQKVADCSAKSIHFSIHGGEPLLRKSRYLLDIFELQKQYLKEKDVSNSIQTNGTFIDDEFISAYRNIEESGVRVGLGVSLDGPEMIHDASRIYRKGGGGSYHDVMRGIELLAQNEINVAILSVANLTFADRAAELYPFFKSLPNVHFLDLLVPRKDSFPDASSQSLSKMFNVVFDDWFFDVDGHFEIRFFCSVIVALLTDRGVLCTFQENCVANQNMISVAPDGSASFCDSFPEVVLGNVLADSIDELVDMGNRTRMRWSMREEKRLEHCLFCKWYKICHGGCPVDYCYEGGVGPYFCDDYKRIFGHIESRMKAIGVHPSEGLCDDTINKFNNPAIRGYLRMRRNQYLGRREDEIEEQEVETA
jgi:uncharacterized protein